MIIQRLRSGTGRKELSCMSGCMCRPAKGAWVRLTIALLISCSLPPASIGAGVEGPDSTSWRNPAKVADNRHPVAPNESSLAEGKRLFQQECVTCHGSVGKGDGSKAKALKVTPPDLSDPKIAQQSDGVLARKITEGKTPMPSFGSKLSKHEVWAVINYIRTLAPAAAAGSSLSNNPQANQGATEQSSIQDSKKNSSAEPEPHHKAKSQPWTAPARVARKRNSVPRTDSNIAKGKELYEEECLGCHGLRGKGDGHVAATFNISPADLSDPRMWQQTDGELFWKVNTGKPPMPSFQLRFSTRQVWGLVDYIRTLAPRDVQAGQAKPIRRQTESALICENGRTARARLPWPGMAAAPGKVSNRINPKKKHRCRRLTWQTPGTGRGLL